MNEAMDDAFRHNTWATKTLVAVCRGLPPEQLTRPAAGFGSILETLNHLVTADAYFATALTGEDLSELAVRGELALEAGNRDDVLTLDELDACADETWIVWERMIAGPVDAERLVLLDEGTYEVRSGIVIAHALHHGSMHREQVCAALTAQGAEPPDLQPWEYADTTGLSRWLTAES